MSKRRRFGPDPVPDVVVIHRAAKRPVNKHIKVINVGNVSNIQQRNDLLTFTYPGTITGLRWNMAFILDTVSTEEHWQWAIIIIRDGQIEQIMSATAGTDFYDPEQEVLVFGIQSLSASNGAFGITIEGSTKTMRKMQGGDRLSFIVKGLSSTQTGHVAGMVQFFVKT